MAHSVSADLDNILLKSAHTDTQYETTKSFILLHPLYPTKLLTNEAVIITPQCI